MSYAPSAVTAPATLFSTSGETGAISTQMDAAATGSLSNRTLTFAGGATGVNFGWISAPNLPGKTSWPAQSYNVRLMVTAPNASLVVTEVQLYRVDLNGGPSTSGLATLADLSGLNVQLGPARTIDFILSGTAQSAAATDRIGVKFYVKNNSTTAQSFSYQAGSGTGSSFLASTTLYADAVLSANPVQYFQLAELSGTAALDSSPAKSNGTYVGPVALGAAGPLKTSTSNAVALSGGTLPIGASLPSPSAPAGTSYTIETWVYPMLTTGYMTIWGYDSTHRLLVGSNGVLTAQFGGSFSTHEALSSGSWHHVVYVYDAPTQTASYYVDGGFDNSGPVTQAAAAFTGTYFAGQFDTGTLYKFNGRLAHQTFYRSALTPAQVLRHYTLAGYATPSPSPESACVGPRFSIKTATDPGVSAINTATDTATTIDALRAIPAPMLNNASPRITPTESTIWTISNVTVTSIQKGADLDYHLVLTAPTGHTMIVESADPSCATSSTLASKITTVRNLINTAIPNVSTTLTHPNKVLTVKGVGFFDHYSGTLGQAPNGIELHPLTAICFGTNCTP